VCSTYVDGSEGERCCKYCYHVREPDGWDKYILDLIDVSVPYASLSLLDGVELESHVCVEE
jgi:hypothetical protein